MHVHTISISRLTTSIMHGQTSPCTCTWPDQNIYYIVASESGVWCLSIDPLVDVRYAERTCTVAVATASTVELHLSGPRLPDYLDRLFWYKEAAINDKTHWKSTMIQTSLLIHHTQCEHHSQRGHVALYSHIIVCYHHHSKKLNQHLTVILVCM